MKIPNIFSMKDVTFSIAKSTAVLLVVTLALAGCATQPPEQCGIALKSPLGSAMQIVEDKLAGGCAYSFDNYVDQLLDIAVDNPSKDNKRQFSDFLVRVSDQGTISKRQAKALYNRYFNIKFVSLTGEYNTCSQVCPVQGRVLADMQSELLDKELGMMQAGDDANGYYRADHLLKEAQIVLEATCRACSAGGI